MLNNVPNTSQNNPTSDTNVTLSSDDQVVFCIVRGLHIPIHNTMLHEQRINNKQMFQITIIALYNKSLMTLTKLTLFKE